MPKLDRVTYSHITALQIHRFMQRNLATTLASSSRTRSAPQTSVSTHDAATVLANALRDHAIGSREFRNASEALEFLSLEGVCAPLHFVTSSQGQCRRKGDIEAHLLSTQVSSDSFFELTRGCLVCSPELAFVQCADRRTDFTWLLELGYELCGTYQTARTGLTTQYEVQALTSTQRIRDFLKRDPSLRGSRFARQALLYMSDGSASPRETALALLLGLPHRLGGYGLEIPLMNHPVKLNEQAASIAQRASLRCDLCWPKSKVDVEYQSDFAHQGEFARIRDSRRANALATMQWTTIGVTSEEMNSMAACDAIAEAVRKATQKQRRANPADFERKHRELRWKLGLPC